MTTTFATHIKQYKLPNPHRPLVPMQQRFLCHDLVEATARVIIGMIFEGAAQVSRTKI